MPVVKRPGPEVRREEIMAAALALAKKVGFSGVTREGVAKQAGCSPRLMNYYYGSIIQLKRDLMRAAIAAKELKVIAQGLAVKDRVARRAPEELKQQAVAALL